MREYSVPVLVDVPATANCADTVFQRGEQQPEAVVISRKTGDGWTPVTAAELRDQVAAVARGLIAAGVEPGDRVALMSRTRYEWTVADYAIWAAGAVGVPIYDTSSPDQVSWILSDSGAKGVIVETGAHAKTVDQAVTGLAEAPTVWTIDDGAFAALAAAGADVPGTTLDERRHFFFFV